LKRRKRSLRRSKGGGSLLAEKTGPDEGDWADRYLKSGLERGRIGRKKTPFCPGGGNARGGSFHLGRKRLAQRGKNWRSGGDQLAK